jgi:hypothetical protein
MKEIFKDYPQDKRYKVSNLGRIIGAKGYLLKPFIDKKNYSAITIKDKTVKVHHLVAETFKGHIRCGHNIVVDHIDNNPQNNRIDNLQLISHRKNCSKDKSAKTSYLSGVSLSKSNKYRSQVCLNSKVYYLGEYKTEQDAHIAYIDALYEYELTK